MSCAAAAPRPPERLELHLSYSCGQRCAFCSESGRMARYRGVPVTGQEAAALLKRKRAEGCSHVTLTGGEPTEHPQFLAVAGAAKRLGYRVYVTSNGGRLADPVFAERALPWLDELCLSVHGADARLHDGCAGTKGSFDAVRSALANATRAWPRLKVLTNTVVTTLNVDDAERTLEWLLGHEAVSHCLLSNAAPEGRASRSYRRLAVPLDRWRALIPGIAELADRAAAAVRLFGLPLCVFGPHAALSNDLYWSPRVTAERAGEPVKGRARLAEEVCDSPARRRLKPAPCGRCALAAHCGGVFDAYVALRGSGELRPAAPAGGAGDA